MNESVILILRHSVDCFLTCETATLYVTWSSVGDCRRSFLAVEADLTDTDTVCMNRLGKLSTFYFHP